MILRWFWWLKSLSPFQKLFPAGFVALYWLALWGLGGFRSDHCWFGLGVLGLNYLGPLAKKFQNFILPLLLTGIIYDSQRFYSDYIRGPIHVTEPYNFDKRFFGISTPQGMLTPNEWLQLHTHPVLDVVTGFFYLTFIAIFVLLAAYFYFWASHRGTKLRSAGQIAAEAPKIMWSFFWVNMVGYSTYYWYAAAPPWYVAAYGLGPAHLEAAASSAGCVRFDQILGTHFFSEMYGRAADVFGAIPSLHVAYPLISVIFAFRLGAWRGFSTFFYLIMCFAAVYLNHHYILDIFWGSGYAVLTVLAVDRYYSRKGYALETAAATAPQEILPAALSALAFAALLGALGISPRAQADNSAPTTPGAESRANKRKPNPAQVSQAGKDTTTIRGRCVIVPSASNPLGGPCVNLLIVLNQIDLPQVSAPVLGGPNPNVSGSPAPAVVSPGIEVARTRTDSDGIFEFAADPLLTYRIASGSRFYTVLSPSKPFHGGVQVGVQFQQN